MKIDMIMDNNAAHSLEGRTSESGWFVKKKQDRDVNQSGSNFSVGYIVEKNDETCFMKAFDFAGFLSLAVPKDEEEAIDPVDVINDMTTAYIYERELSKHCQDKHVTKVSFVKESGQEYIKGFSIQFVPYLIFDLAEGDVRRTLNISGSLDYAWRFKSLHDIAIGLKQLHTIEVSHQDLKPSNVLVFSNESKIGDLGRSICKDIEGPYSKSAFTGDRTYAPPEIWYRYYEKDWQKRVFATDCYMLGSMIVFYFSGISMSALLRKHIPDNFSWERWTGSIEELKPYLENAFSSALDEFEMNINKEVFKKDLRQLVEYLCNPFPERRGHPINISSRGNSYNMERFVTMLDVLKAKAELHLMKI
ncbi:MAG: protein kinase [Candidatus Paceibacterota bacterium]